MNNGSEEELSIEDGEILLPWSPKHLIDKKVSRINFSEKEESSEDEDLTSTPIDWRKGNYPRRDKINFQFQKATISEETETEKEQGFETPPSSPKFESRGVPWSPFGNQLNPLQIAYLFGNHAHPVVKKLKDILSTNFHVELITQVSAQPPKPFPIFYLYTDKYDINKAMEAGIKTSDGHCIYIRPENIDVKPSDKSIPIIILPNNWEDDEDLLIKLCEEMAEQTNQVHENTNPKVEL